MKEKLDIIYEFGKDVITEARDITIKQSLNTIDGISKAPLRIKLYSKLQGITDQQKDVIKEIIIDSIDGAINNFLWMMEENNDKYAFTAKCGNGEAFDIEQESDGLCMGQWEFIDQYSKYNTVDEILETGKIEKESSEESTP